MKNKISLSLIITIVLILTLMIGMGMANAATDSYMLNPFNAKLIVNGIDKTVLNNQYFNGKTNVPSLLNYNGTTYVPLRLFSELLGEKVDYKNSTIYIGNISSDIKTFEKMTPKISPYYCSKNTVISVDEDVVIGGKKYIDNIFLYESWHGYSEPYGDVESSYNLNGEYIQIKGKIGLTDEYNRKDAVVDIYGDDRLIKSYHLKAGELPQDLSLDVKGILRLDINYKADGTQLCLFDIYIK